MQDLYKNHLSIGDAVAFNPPSYKGLIKGNVIKFTPKMVEVEYRWQGQLERTKVFPRDLCRPLEDYREYKEVSRYQLPEPLID